MTMTLFSHQYRDIHEGAGEKICRSDNLTRPLAPSLALNSSGAVRINQPNSALGALESNLCYAKNFDKN